MQKSLLFSGIRLITVCLKYLGSKQLCCKDIKQCIIVLLFSDLISKITAVSTFTFSSVYKFLQAPRTKSRHLDMLYDVRLDELGVLSS